MPRRELPLTDRIEDLRQIAMVRRLVREGRVREIREAAGMTQESIAEVVMCTPSAISQYESGTRVPSGETALRLAAALNALREVGS
jgi:DNA-binding XRE family transcriptional regulator